MGRASTEDDFAVFVSAHERRLRQALTSLLGPERGREATAEALSYGWEHWARVSQMENPAGYLYTTGRARVLRGERRRRSRSGPMSMPIPRPPDAGERWFEPMLPALIDELSERERQIVMLLHGFEWTMSEVAELLDVSKSTVQTHAERGLAKLREGLGVTS